MTSTITDVRAKLYTWKGDVQKFWWVGLIYIIIWYFF